MWSANNNNNRNLWPPNIPSQTANNQDWGSLAQQWASQKTNVQNWPNPSVLNNIRNGHPSLPFGNPQQYTSRQFGHQQYYDHNLDCQSSNFSFESYPQKPYNGAQSHNLSLLGPQPGHNDIQNTNTDMNVNYENEYPAYTNYDYNNLQKEPLRNWNDGEEPPDLYNTNREAYNETYDKNLNNSNYQSTTGSELDDNNSSMLPFQTNFHAQNTTNLQVHSLEQTNAFNSNFSQQSTFQPPTINPLQNSMHTDSMANFLNLNNPNQFGAQSNMSWASTLPQANPLLFGIMPPIAGLSNPPIPPQFLAGLPQNFIPNVHHQHRKTLPAWLKEGLEKMEKEKQKRKGSNDNEESFTKDGEWPTYPNTDIKSIIEVETEIDTPKSTLNKLAGQTPPSFKGEASPYPNSESQSENEFEGMTPKVPPSRDLITNIKLLLTEVLMDSTSYLITKVAAEQMLIIQNEIKEKNLQKSRKALSKISSLGIAEYGSEGDSSQEEDDFNLPPTALSSPDEPKSIMSSLPTPSTATELLESRSSTPNVSCVMPNVISNNIEISESHSNVGVDTANPDNGTTMKGGDEDKGKETLDSSPTQNIPLPMMPGQQARTKDKKEVKVGQEAVPSLKPQGFSLIEELNRNKLKTSKVSRDPKLTKGSGKGADTSRSKRKDRSPPHSKTKSDSKIDKLKLASAKRRSPEKRKDVHSSARAKRSRSASRRKEKDKIRRKISRSRSKGKEKKAEKSKQTDNAPMNSSSAKQSVKEESKLAEKNPAQPSDKGKGDVKSSKANEEKSNFIPEENQPKVKVSKNEKIDDADKVTNLKKPSVTVVKTAKKKDECKKASRKSKERKKSIKKHKKKSHSSKGSDRKKKRKRDKKHKHASKHRRHKTTSSESPSSDTSSESSSDSTDSSTS